jgi:serine/threonine protein kinase/WD40 repeat protein
MRTGSPSNNQITLITASLASDRGLLDVLQVIDSFVTTPFDITVAVNRQSVETFLKQLTPLLPDELHERILNLVEIYIEQTAPRLVKVTELTPSSADPHNITRFLADGGIGRVWVADDEHLGREVVLKQLLPKSADSVEIRARFVQEAQITGQLQHPNIVPVYSMDQDGNDAPFYTMRYIRGHSFNIRIQTMHDQYQGNVRSQEFHHLLEEFICVCNAVSYAHSQGILHCDLKPENVAVGQFGEVTVLDWGLAHRFDVSRLPSDTSEEYISGTPNYLSPEQAKGVREGLTPATDIYSLGAVLFELLFNRPPRRVEDQPSSLPSLLNSVIKGDIPRAVDIAPRSARMLAHICDKCLATTPTDRYSSVQLLLDDLYRWRDDERVHAAPNLISYNVARYVRRHQRTTVTALFILLIATIVTTGFYSAVTLSQNTLRRARNSERHQQSEIDQQQTVLSIAITDAIDARRQAETGEHAAQLQITSSAKAILDHQMARQRAVVATEQATVQQRKAAVATADADSQSKIANINRVSLDVIRTRTEQLSYQRQLDIESGYTNTAMQLANAGDYQTALAWASVSRDHAQTTNRSPMVLAEHQIRIMAIRSHLPALIGYLQFSKSPSLTAYSTTSNALAMVSIPNLPTNSTVQLLRINTLEPLHPAFNINLSASAIGFSSDGSHLIIAGTTFEVPITTELVCISLSDASMERVTISTNDQINTLVSTNDTIVLGTNAGLLNTYTFPNITLQKSIHAHRDAITTTSLSPDRSMVATGSLDATARLWQLDTLTPLSLEMKHKTAVMKVRFSEINSSVVTTAQNGFSLAWDSTLFLTKPKLARGPAPSFDQNVTATAHHPAELIFAIGTATGDVRIFNRPGSEFISPLSFDSSITTLKFSKDGRLLIIGTAEGKLSIYDFSQRQMIYDKISHLGSISSVNISINNQFVTVATSTGKLLLWDLAQTTFAPALISEGNAPSLLRLSSSQSSILFTTNDSTLHEVSPEHHFQHQGTELDFGTPIDQVVLSQQSTDGFVITNRVAHPITTSELKPAGAQIEFSGEILDVTIAGDGNYALSSQDRTITVGQFNNDTPRIRITAHKLPARFIRFTADSSVLVVFGASRNETGNRVIQTVSITDDTVLKRVVVPFDVNSVAAALLPNSNELVVTSNRGGVWRVDVNSLTFKPLSNLELSARRLINHRQIEFLLTRDDTIVQFTSANMSQMYPSSFQTIHTSYNAELNWILRANDTQFSIQSVATGHPICPPITVVGTIRDVLLVAQANRPNVIVATDDGVYRYSIESMEDTINSSNLHLLCGSRLDHQKHLVKLSYDDVSNLLMQTDLRSPDSPETLTPQTLTWLRQYSTNISPSQWKPHIDQLRIELSKPSVDMNSSTGKAIVTELNYALLSAGSYLEAIKQILSLPDADVKSTYQAVVLAAWIDNSSLYNQALRVLLKKADPRVAQHFVYLLNGLSLAPHDYSTDSLINTLDRLPERLAGNSLVQRGQLAFAIFQGDRLQVTKVLSKMAKSDLPLPIRVYAKMAYAWTTSKSITDSDLRQLHHQLDVLPSLESGNPGRSWDERCLLDILWRRVQLSASTGGPIE